MADPPAVEVDGIQQWISRAIGGEQGRTGGATPATRSQTSFSSDNSRSTVPALQAQAQMPSSSSPAMPNISSLEATIQDPNATLTDFDRVLAKELNQLSLEDRERNYEEVHGVATIQEETPLFLQQKIQELQAVIAHTP